MQAITEPGLYEMTAAEYHADPCPAPSLSASIAKELVLYSPWHAWCAHPRLNPGFEREEKTQFDLGSAAHAYFLEGESPFVVVNAPDWKKKDAQEQKAAARLEGKIPLLTHQWQDVIAMVDAANLQLIAHRDRPRPFTAGKPEQTLIWREGPVWCRARLDWLHDDHLVIDDYKTTGGTANPEGWTRAMFALGFDIQAAFYLRGVRAVFGTEAKFRFVPQENFAPFALSVVGAGRDVLMLAEKKVAYALEQWATCLATQRWPGYPTKTCWAQLPPWEEARWLERELREEGAERGERGVVDDGSPIEELLARGTRP